MPDESIYEGVKQEIRGLKDPGNILIVVYILLVLFLLLFTGLESARADFGQAKEGTFSIECTGDVSCSGSRDSNPGLQQKRIRSLFYGG